MLTADRLPRSGKVRDLYTLPDRSLALVASDRISAFDVILPTAIPDKGKVLTGLSRFWFGETSSIVANHLLDTRVAAVTTRYAQLLEGHGKPAAELMPPDGFEAWRGRLMVCRPARVIPIEAVVRGYLAGSGWKEYRDRGTVCGIRLPAGLREGDRLPTPIFTPASKAPLGHHDENLSFDAAIEYVGAYLFETSAGRPTSLPLPRAVAAELVERVAELALRLYGFGAAVAERAGILLADTKFEFGLPITVHTDSPGPDEEHLAEWREPSTTLRVGPGSGAQVMLIDEVMTPDSSRFWDAAAWAPGGPQPSYDKQFVRDWLERQAWDKTAPGPALPDEVVAGTRARYVEAFERITGASFDRYLQEDVIAR
ncbi:MAG TPA: phosphoribosylaminoimidazolesuccinocarboxamide synthase [Candidatus Limnocylindrales bacterium]